MTNHIINTLSFFHENGLDSGGRDTLIKQIPYWQVLLDEDYKTPDYQYELSFIKGMGYRVYRNPEGKHKVLTAGK